MKREIFYGLGGGLILSAIGLVIGLVTGFNIGGNYYPEFAFLGVRGYEATGYLGAMFGAAAGMFLGVLVGVKFTKNRKRGKQ